MTPFKIRNWSQFSGIAWPHKPHYCNAYFEDTFGQIFILFPYQDCILGYQTYLSHFHTLFLVLQTVWRAMFNNSTFTNASNSTNGTEPGPGPGPRPPPSRQVDVVGMVFYCLLALLIVVENLPMIIAFYVNRQLRTKANLLLMSLIMANMVTGTIFVPLWVYISLTYTFRGLLYDFYIILDVMIIGSSALSMTLMSLERCYALIKAIKHRNIRKSKYFNG